MSDEIRPGSPVAALDRLIARVEADLATLKHARSVAAGETRKALRQSVMNCTCYHSCERDSHSGDWHQHEDEPCPVHPDAMVVG